MIRFGRRYGRYNAADGFGRATQERKLAGGNSNPGQQHSGDRTIRYRSIPHDVLAQCPKCKTMETLQFDGYVLMTSRKFYQKNGLVPHDCGSALPCRLRGLSSAAMVVR
jgi:hypothetical protein